MRYLAALLSLLSLLPLSAAQAQIVGTLPYQLTNGTIADASQVMANYSYIISQVNANAANGGANSNISSLSGLTTPLSPYQGGSQYYSAGVSTGSANAQVVASGITPSGFVLLPGMIVSFTAGYTNTGATTLAFSGTAAIAVKQLSASGLVALSGGEIVAGNPVLAFYDGAQFDLITNTQFRQYGKFVNLASATTTDLGTALTHNVNITGTTTITSFGSTAQTDFPTYNLVFATSLTLAYNGTSLILPGSANIVTQANDAATAIYLGSGNWLVTSYVSAATPPAAVGIALPGVVGFSQYNNSSTPNSKIDLGSSVVLLTNTSGNGVYYSNPSACTINLTVNGAGGLDTGSLASSTWYYTYYISNGTTLSCLGSTSSSSPTLPSGYTYYARVGAMQTDGSSNLYRMRQAGRTAQYVITGSTNTSAFPFTTVSTATVTVKGNGYAFPSTAVKGMFIAVASKADSSAFVSPNGGYNIIATGGGNFTNPVSPGSSPNTGYWGGVASAIEFVLEGPSVNYVGVGGSGSALLECFGWVDSVNAN